MFGDLFDLDFFGGSDYGMEAANQAASNIPEAFSPAMDLSSYAEPAITAAAGAGAGQSPWYADLLSGGSNFAKMAGDILGNPTFQRLVVPAATVGLGSVLGQKAGSAVEKKFKPTTQEQAVTQNMYNQPVDFQTLAAQMTQLMSPQIQESLDRERQAAGGILNRQAMHPSYSSATNEAIGRTQAATNRGIAAAIANAVGSARGQNMDAQLSALRQAQSMRGQGVNQGLVAAGQAGQAPIQAYMLSQLMGMGQRGGGGGFV